MALVLVVEDDPKIRELVTKNLESSGFETRVAGDGDRALEVFEQVQPDLVLLDLMIPRIDGLEVCRRLRTRTEVPILMLTARSGEADKVLGFEIGADDYLTKPFSTAELIARVRALLRRSSPPQTDGPLVRGALQIDVARMQVERDGARIELTTLEFELLRFLAEHPGRVYSREQLLYQVWGEDRMIDDRSIDSLISRLRRKLEPNPAKPRYVQTVWGAGYRFGEAP